ncbi:MAG: cupin domain-containing protein [Victivallales bacterium]|nr:cupin domain-containing protein [Victivallales bacterium]
MIRRNGEYGKVVKDNMRGGEGRVLIENLWDPDTELKANNRLFARLTIEPGSSIGFHKHEKEEEVFVIEKGIAEMDDNGKVERLYPGDTILTADGAGHSVKSVGDENLEMLAVISCWDGAGRQSRAEAQRRRG